MLATVGLILAVSYAHADQNIPVKSPSSSSIQYVLASGNDSNDGLSWGTAKLTVMAAYTALPGKGGTIYISGTSNTSGTSASCVHATATAGQGIWIAGSTDPNYANLPTGWYRAKQTGVTIVGIPSTSHASGSSFPQACVVAGGSTNNAPAVKLSSMDGGIGFFNLNFIGGGRGLVIGEDSNGGRTGTGVVANAWLENTSFAANTSSASNGPSIDITGSSFQIYFDNFVVNANTTAIIGSNQGAAMLLDGTNNNGVGLIHVNHAHFNGGGLKYIPGVNGGSFYATNVITENQASGDAGFHLTSTSGTTAQIFNVNIADCGSGINGVQVDGGIGTAPENVLTYGIQNGCGPNLVGEMTDLGGQLLEGLGTQTISALRQGQIGLFNGRIYGQQDSSRSQFSPTAVRFANLALPLASWTLNGAGTLTTTGITAPDGTTGAGQAVSSSGSNAILLYNKLLILSVSDYLLAGAWVRSQTANGYSGGINNVLGLTVTGSGDTVSTFGHGAPIEGDGEWEWVWKIVTVTAAPISPATVVMSVAFDNTHTIQSYAPILLHITAGTVSANEAYNIAFDLASYGPYAPVGSIAGLPGQELAVPGSTQFYGLFTHANTVNRIYALPDASGTICESNAPCSVTNLTASGTTRIGNGSTIKKILLASGLSLKSAFKSISAGTCEDQTLTVIGAGITGVASVSPTTALGKGFSWSAWVSASDTVSVHVCAGATGTPNSVKWNVEVVQ
jgi:hypothetical protein